MSERAVYFHPVPGIEALQARFVEHAYMPHSHPTWTVAVVHHGSAQFEVDATRQRADSGELFVLERDAAASRAAKWVVFRARALQDALLRMHSALAAGATGLELDEAIGEPDRRAGGPDGRARHRRDRSAVAASGRGRGPPRAQPPPLTAAGTVPRR